MSSRPIRMIVCALVVFVAYSQLTIQRQASAAFADMDSERSAQSLPERKSALGTGPTRNSDPSFDVPVDADAMAFAVKTARNTFESFWAKTSNRGPDRVTAPSIKVGVAYSGGREHVWMKNCARRTLEIFVCTVSNAPASVNLSRGERYEFRLPDVSDWMYRRDGKIHGAYSLRAMLPRLADAQAASLKGQLAPL